MRTGIRRKGGREQGRKGGREEGEEGEEGEAEGGEVEMSVQKAILAQRGESASAVPPHVPSGPTPPPGNFSTPPRSFAEGQLQKLVPPPENRLHLLSVRRVSRSNPLPGMAQSRKASSGRPHRPPRRQTGASGVRVGARPPCAGTLSERRPGPCGSALPQVGGRGGAQRAGNGARRNSKAAVKNGASLRKGACLPQAVHGGGRGGYASTGLNP
jgi:hypothetical protein